MRETFSTHIASLFRRPWAPWIAGPIGGLVVVLHSAPSVLAHEGQPPAPHDFWEAWNWDPFLLTLLSVGTFLYARGVHRLWKRAGTGRGISRKQAAAFAGSIVTLFIALVSPLDALSEALFSAHMVQHLLLIVVAAPLFIYGAPFFAILWAVPLRWRQTLGRYWQKVSILHDVWNLTARPATVWLLYAFTLWMWHFPLFYEAAIHNDFIHELEHASFFGTAGLFWWILFDPMGRRKLTQGASLLYLFTTMLHSSALGVLVTFSPEPWYPAHAPYTEAWQLTLLQDQQLAGSIMWMPVCMVYIGVAVGILLNWMQNIDGKASLRVKE